MDHGVITVGEDLRVRVARSVAGSSARGLLEKLDAQAIRLPVDRQLYPDLDHGVITVGEDLRVRVARSVAGSSARGLLEKLDDQAIRLPVDRQFYPDLDHLLCYRKEVFKTGSLTAGWSLSSCGPIWPG